MLEALHWVPCFYKFSHLIEHLAECFHVEVIDGVQYSHTWSWVKINTLDCKEIQPVHSEGDQPQDFFGGNDAEAETPVLWPPHAKS